MIGPYLHERQAEYWTSRGVEDYFLDAGFEVISFPLTQRSEHEIPFDFVFMEKSTCKMFGFQYKALYHNGSDYWPLNQAQHEALQAFQGWAHYALSEMRSSKDHRVALHQTIFVPVTIPYSERLFKDNLERYRRWGGFADGLNKCQVGRRVESREDIEALLHPRARKVIDEVDEHLVDVFVANLKERKLLHLDGR